MPSWSWKIVFVGVAIGLNRVLAEFSMLVPFSLTYVRYDDNDAYSLILALFTLSPIFIIVMYATILLIRRDLQTLLILLGQFMNLFLNLLLKHTLNIPRPVERYFVIVAWFWWFWFIVFLFLKWFIGSWNAIESLSVHFLFLCYLRHSTCESKRSFSCFSDVVFFLFISSWISCLLFEVSYSLTIMCLMLISFFLWMKVLLKLPSRRSGSFLCSVLSSHSHTHHSRRLLLELLLELHLLWFGNGFAVSFHH